MAKTVSKCQQESHKSSQSHVGSESQREADGGAGTGTPILKQVS